MVISGSRDKSIMVWRLYDQPREEGSVALVGQPYKALTGHSHFITDLALSNENKYLISASWDHELRLWDLGSGVCKKRFVGHEKEVFTVAFSPDNRQIISSGAEKKLKLFNTLGDCKFTSEKSNHTDWVSMVRFSPANKGKSAGITPYFVSVGWDGWLKVWNLNYTLRFAFKAHDSNINAVAISPNGKLIASGGKDKKLFIWDITDLRKPSSEYDAGSTINQIAFHPLLHWVAAATENEIRIWQIDGDKKHFYSLEHVIETRTGKRRYGCTSLTFDCEGFKLYGGFADGTIGVWEINKKSQ